MGGAFSAIADDATAIFWNPAGLSRIGEEQLAFMHADLFGSGIREDQAAFVLPLSPAPAQVLGGAWYHSGYDDHELTFGENRFDLSYALHMPRWAALGSTLKLLTRGIELDGSTLGQGRGLGMDLGVLVSPTESWSMGAVAKDVFDTRLEYTSGDVTPGSSVAYARNLHAGIAYSWRHLGTLALDVDQRIHLGLEAFPRKEFALRAGLREDPSAHDLTYAFGAGFRTGSLRFDYAYEVHPVLGATHHFGLNMGFHLNPARIRIRTVRPEELYASLYRSYDRQAIGTVEIENRHDKPLAMKLGVVIPELMRSPVEYDTTLRPQAVTVLPLRAVLSHSVLENSGDRSIHLQVDGTYENGRTTRRDRLVTKTMLYASGAINWAKGTDQAAAFVTMHDPIISDLASRAVRGAESEGAFAITNLGSAAALVDALALQGITYIPDPDNPYSTISEKPHAVDTVRYPRETLRRLSGDCDDTSVLLSALLESVGIPTRMVDAPGHLFVMFDSGISPPNRPAIPFPDRLLVTDSNRLWIPLETTSLAHGFAAAWQAGAEGCATWKDVMKTIDVAAAQERYPESEVPGPSPSMVSLDPSALRGRLQIDSDTLRSWSREFLQATSAPAGATDVSASSLVQLARVYLEADDLDAAQTTLRRGLHKEPSSPTLLNDLAVVSAARGDYGEARRLLEKVVSLDPADAGHWLNLGISSARGGDQTAARRAYGEALKRVGGVEAACRLLGIAVPSDAGRMPSVSGSKAIAQLEAAIAQATANRNVAMVLYWRR